MNVPAIESIEEVTKIAALRLLRRRSDDGKPENTALPLAMINEIEPGDAQMLLHELRVHQIELEMQNEELRRVQRELEVARERYFDLYDLAPVGYCTVNEQGLILEANLTAATLLGVLRGALVNQPIVRFIPWAQQPVFNQCCRQVDAEELTQNCELQMVRRDGSQIWVGVSVNVAKCISGVTTLRVMLKDITERVQKDEALCDKNVELERIRHVADKANHAKSDFLAGMSHELRSPLNAILGFAQLMDAGSPPPTPAQKLAIDQILHGGWYLLELVNEILDLATIESGKLQLTMGTESLADVLQDCQAMIEPLATASGIQLSFPTIDQSCLVQADRRRLKQVVINLLSNAIKYNRMQGSVKVRWSLRPNKHVRISVQDTGHGLTADQLTQLFQPFSRLGQEAGVQEGTGIGLVVSKRLVELMGGEIGAQSTVGEGSVFWFELLLADPNL